MIDTHHLEKRFGNLVAVRDLTLHIGAGEIVGLLGKNGAGKTTLTELILGLVSPTSGTVTVCGTPPHQAISDARIGAVMQTGGLLPDVTVRDTLAMIAATHANPIKIDDAIEHARLAEIADRRVGACSGGQQQRVRFALALLGRPDILILDEPTTGLDPASRQAFFAALREQANEGRTIVFSTHRLEEAEQFAQRVLIMDRGSVIADAPPTSLTAERGMLTVTAAVSARYADVVPQSHYADGVLTIRTPRSDEVARWLLNKTDARDVRIAAASLEETFLALTSPAQTEPAEPAETTELTELAEGARS